MEDPTPSSPPLDENFNENKEVPHRRTMSSTKSTDFVEQDEPFLDDEPQLQSEVDEEYRSLNLEEMLKDASGDRTLCENAKKFLERDNFEAELGFVGPHSDDASAGISAKDEKAAKTSDDDAASYSTLSGNVEQEKMFLQVAKYQIMDVIGADTNVGRLMIVFYAYRLPDMKSFDQTLFLEYITRTLDQYVEQDYTIIYFHYGLKSYNRPSLRWLINAYKILDRKYKKNLKALYLVHPTRFIRIAYALFKPLLSSKFEQKITYVNYLFELNEQLPGFSLNFHVPVEIENHDALLRSTYNIPSKHLSNNALSKERLRPTRQFGVTLNFILKNYPNEANLPPIVVDLIDFLQQSKILCTKGLFRRSAVLSEVERIRNRIDSGEKIEFVKVWDESKAHLAAVLLKTFLRNLPEPLMTYELFAEVLKVQGITDRQESVAKIKWIVDKLPIENKSVLHYVVKFLSKVMEKSDLNLMNATNLAIVFGPNLAWAGDQPTTLAQLQLINNFVYKLLVNSDKVFDQQQ